MDKKFVKQHKFLNEVKRFSDLLNYDEKKGVINEYTFITSKKINEDDDELEDLETDEPSDSDEESQGNDGNMGDQPQQEVGQEQPTSDDYQEDEVETEEMEDGDEVIDIDDLTQSQKATEYKVDGVDERLTAIYAAVEKFKEQLDSNADMIRDLKSELERRNPTEEERMNLRSLSSYPFSENPQNFWDKKMATNPNYKVISDNDVNGQEEEDEKYEILDKDINGLNMRAIADTLSPNITLDSVLKF